MVVLELLQWKAPAALILAIVLLASNTKVPQHLDIDFCEFFAGEGQVSLALWSVGLRGSSHDIRYSNLMDLCSVAGFASLSCIFSWTVCWRSCVLTFAHIKLCVFMPRKGGPQWAVEHQAWGIVPFWYLLQQLYQDVPDLQYIKCFMLESEIMSNDAFEIVTACPKVVPHCRARCVERLFRQWWLWICEGGEPPSVAFGTDASGLLVSGGTLGGRTARGQHSAKPPSFSALDVYHQGSLVAFDLQYVSGVQTPSCQWLFVQVIYVMSWYMHYWNHPRLGNSCHVYVVMSVVYLRFSAHRFGWELSMAKLLSDIDCGATMRSSSNPSLTLEVRCLVRQWRVFLVLVMVWWRNTLTNKANHVE